MSVLFLKAQTTVVAGVVQILKWQTPKTRSLCIVNKFVKMILAPEFESFRIDLDRIISNLVGDTYVLIIVNNKLLN